MAKRKQPKQLKVQVNFTPTVDFDVRLKRVMELLMRPPRIQDVNHKESGDNHA